MTCILSHTKFKMAAVQRVYTSCLQFDTYPYIHVVDTMGVRALTRKTIKGSKIYFPQIFQGKTLIFESSGLFEKCYFIYSFTLQKNTILVF